MKHLDFNGRILMKFTILIVDWSTSSWAGLIDFKAKASLWSIHWAHAAYWAFSLIRLWSPLWHPAIERAISVQIPKHIFHNKLFSVTKASCISNKLTALAWHARLFGKKKDLREKRYHQYTSYNRLGVYHYYYYQWLFIYIRYEINFITYWYTFNWLRVFSIIISIVTTLLH